MKRFLCGYISKTKKDADDMERRSITLEALPTEAWKRILDQVDGNLKEVLALRLVNSGFKQEVDKYLDWTTNDLDSQLTIYIYGVTRLSTLEDINKFESEIKSGRGNPFPSGVLSFYPERCDHERKSIFSDCVACVKRLHQMYRNLIILCKQFGSFVHGLEFILGGAKYVKYLRVLEHLPNLRYLELGNRRIVGTIWTTDKKKWISHYKFPALAHFRSLKILMDPKESEMILPRMLNSYGKQLLSWDLIINDKYDDVIGYISADMMPNLVHFKYTDISSNSYNQGPVFDLVKRSNWALTKLSILEMQERWWGNNVEEVFSVVNKFSSTLAVLDLHFFDQAVHQFRSLTQRYKLASVFDPTKKFPQLKKFTISANCFAYSSVAIGKLCDKFVNLRTIHVSIKYHSSKCKVDDKALEACWRQHNPRSRHRVVVVCGGEKLIGGRKIAPVTTKLFHY